MFVSYITYCSLSKSFLKLKHLILYVYYVIIKPSIIIPISKNKEKMWIFKSTTHQFVYILLGEFTSNLNLFFFFRDLRLLHNIYLFFFISCLSLSVLCCFLIGRPCFAQGVVTAGPSSGGGAGCWRFRGGGIHAGENGRAGRYTATEIS